MAIPNGLSNTDTPSDFNLGGYGTYGYQMMMASGSGVGNDSFINSPGIAGAGTVGQQMQAASGIIAGAGDIAAGYAQKTALGIQAGFNKFQAGENLKRAGMETAELKTQTQTQLEQSGSKANQIIGAQRAAYSSQGVNVNSGTATTEQAAEGAMSAVDTQTILNNAALKAWGIETQGVQTAGEQNLKAMGEEAQGQQSIVLGGAQALNQLFAMQETAERQSAFGSR